MSGEKTQLECTCESILKDNVLVSGDAILEAPIYRILPLRYLLNDITDRRTTMTRVLGWEDTWEAVYFQSPRRFGPKSELIGILPLAAHWFGQCWSLASESVAMWDLYDRNDKSTPKPPEMRGVQISTTPKQLLAGVVTELGKACPELVSFLPITFYLGTVHYMNSQAMEKFIASDLESKLTSNGTGLAQSLLYKRESFDHEREVRLLCQSDMASNSSGRSAIAQYADPTSMASVRHLGSQQFPTRYRLPFDWSGLDSVTIGPRADVATADEISKIVHERLPGVTVSQSKIFKDPIRRTYPA